MCRRYGDLIQSCLRVLIKLGSKDIVRADEKLMEWMSKGHDATAPSYVNGKEIPPMVEVMDYPEKPSTAEFIFMCRRIRSVLSSGRAVALVPKTMGPTYEWSEEAIGHLITNIPGEDGCNESMVWQSELNMDEINEIELIPLSQLRINGLCSMHCTDRRILRLQR